MKKKNQIALKIIKFVEIAVIAMSFSSFASQKLPKQPTEPTTSKTGYMLSVYDGRIAVFETDEEKPIEVFDVYVSSLPYNEQVEVSKGLFAEDRSELQKLIEDYTS